jgi:L-lactate utilization protein LutC
MFWTKSLLHKSNIEFTYEPDPQIRVGVTNALCGLADTGSVLEADGEGVACVAASGIHIVVLKSKDILPSLEDAIHLGERQKVGGLHHRPFAHGDIEMTHTIGVHGPKEIHVFVDDSNSG